MLRRAALALTMIFLLSGCDEIDDMLHHIDTSKITAAPSANNSGSMWGANNNPNCVASITEVKYECTKGTVTDPSGKTNRRAYNLAMTAKVTYDITRPNFYGTPYRADVVFDVMSKNDVVLRSVTTNVHLVENGSSVPASAQIQDISPEEMAKIAKIQARWNY